MADFVEAKLSGRFKALMVVTGLFTFGTVPMILWLLTRSWPRRADPQGLTLRNGRFVRWNEVERVRRVRLVGSGRQVVNEYTELFVGKLVVRLAPSNLTDGAALENFVLAHVPPHALKPATPG